MINALRGVHVNFVGGTIIVCEVLSRYGLDHIAFSVRDILDGAALEIAGCARAMRYHAVAVRPQRTDLVDTAGTGGDHTGSFNISTAAAIVAAGAGAGVAKHGNRSISSKSGSADVLEHLGIPVEVPAEAVAAPAASVAGSAEPQPAIAERWEISPDGRVYTFHLRTNAVWSTGEPITAEDVVYSWRRVVNPATAGKRWCG